jgi:hypothetical protein
MIVRGTTVIAGGTRIRIFDHDPQVAGVGVPSGGDHAGQAAARASRAEEGTGHRGSQRPSTEAVFGAPLQLEK